MRKTWMVLATALMAACIAGEETPVGPPPLDPSCEPRASLDGVDVPRCAWLRGTIDHTTFTSADSLVRAAAALAIEQQYDSGSLPYFRGVELIRAVQHVADFYNAGALSDSARFNRVIDHVAVTVEYVRGTIRSSGTLYFPRRTPGLVWFYYSGTGFYFQPVTTVQRLLPLLSAPNVSTDTLVATGDALWRYTVWHEGESKRFPRWEYLFPWYASGAVWLRPPWESGMAQGSVMELFTELYRRTGDVLWKNRASDVFRSFQVSMDAGGARLPDTSAGYWWEEYHPRVMVWNGSVKALITLGDFAQTMGDTLALRMYSRGLDALKYYTPRYDLGYWTYYSLTGYLATRGYHAYHVELLDALYTQNGDIWFKDLADRWRAYVPPPGVQ